MTDFVACIRALGKPIVEESTKARCFKCNMKVWVSPATRKSIEQGLYPNVFACTSCALEVLKNEKH